MVTFGLNNMKAQLLLLVLAILALGCLQKQPNMSSETIEIKLHTDKEVYVKEPVTIFAENVGNKTVKIKPKIPWKICSDKGCIKIEQSSVAFGIKKNGYESGEWIAIEPEGIAVWTFPPL